MLTVLTDWRVETMSGPEVQYTLQGNTIIMNNTLIFISGSLAPPQSWRAVGRVSSLYIYPVKSCRGVSVPAFTTGPHGPHWAGMVDRSDGDLGVLINCN